MEAPEQKVNNSCPSWLLEQLRDLLRDAISRGNSDLLTTVLCDLHHEFTLMNKNKKNPKKTPAFQAEFDFALDPRIRCPRPRES